MDPNSDNSREFLSRSDINTSLAGEQTDVDENSLEGDSRFEFIDVIGSGGMGEVWRARDHKLDRFVAVKRVKKELAESSNHLARFVNEAKTIAKLNHPNIVQIYDILDHGDSVFIVMELVSGGDLFGKVTQDGGVPDLQLCQIMAQLCAGLNYAHEKGVVHRDVKPQNILLTEAGIPKLTDFGIAKTAGVSMNTVVGAMGTELFMSPEQSTNAADVDLRADVYSVGATTIFCATRHPPKGVIATSLSTSLRPIVEKAMAVNRESRHSNCDELRLAFSAVLDQMSDDGSIDPVNIDLSNLRRIDFNVPAAEKNKNVRAKSGAPWLKERDAAKSLGIAAGNVENESHPALQEALKQIGEARRIVEQARAVVTARKPDWGKSTLEQFELLIHRHESLSRIIEQLGLKEQTPTALAYSQWVSRLHKLETQHSNLLKEFKKQKHDLLSSLRSQIRERSDNAKALEENVLRKRVGQFLKLHSTEKQFPLNEFHDFHQTQIHGADFTKSSFEILQFAEGLHKELISGGSLASRKKNIPTQPSNSWLIYLSAFAVAFVSGSIQTVPISIPSLTWWAVSPLIGFALVLAGAYFRIDNRYLFSVSAILVVSLNLLSSELHLSFVVNAIVGLLTVFVGLSALKILLTLTASKSRLFMLAYFFIVAGEISPSVVRFVFSESENLMIDVEQDADDWPIIKLVNSFDYENGFGNDAVNGLYFVGSILAITLLFRIWKRGWNPNIDSNGNSTLRLFWPSFLLLVFCFASLNPLPTKKFEIGVRHAIHQEIGLELKNRTSDSSESFRFVENVGDFDGERAFSRLEVLTEGANQWHRIYQSSRLWNPLLYLIGAAASLSCCFYIPILIRSRILIGGLLVIASRALAFASYSGEIEGVALKYVVFGFGLYETSIFILERLFVGAGITLLFASVMLEFSKNHSDWIKWQACLIWMIPNLLRSLETLLFGFPPSVNSLYTISNFAFFALIVWLPIWYYLNRPKHVGH